MPRLLLFLCFIVFFSCQGPNPFPFAVTKSGLKKLAWIEGNWMGKDGQTPFYEIYRMVNDTTLEVVSYDWVNGDSTHSSRSYLSWQDGAYYLGEQRNWKVTGITDTSIRMAPQGTASNTILWRRKDANHWEAVLGTKAGDKTYSMERIAHFPKAAQP